MSANATASSLASAGTSVASARLSDRSCSAFSMIGGSCSMLGFAPASRTQSVGSSWTYLAPYRTATLDGHPWKDWATGGRRRRDRAAAAWRIEPLESGQGPFMGAAPSGAGSRGCLRPHAGDSASGTRHSFAGGATTSVRSTAPSPSSKWSRRTSWRRSSERDVSCPPSMRAEFSRHAPGGIVVRVGAALRGSDGFGDVPEVHADTRPGR